MEAKLNTVSAATGRLDNAWGTFCTRLMQSDGGFGELIIMGNDFLANTLNGICRKVVVFMLVGIASILDTRIFQTGKDGSRQASCNYAIGTDGIIGLCVDEQNRSWCSSSRDNDQRAVTIECASDLTDPYAMKPEVYSALLDLSTDICRRNGKRKLVWIADRDKALITTSA